MKLYLDTSALVKLYIAEPNHQHVRQGVTEADSVATSVVAYAEAKPAFARRLRENSITTEEHRQIVAALDSDWIEYERLIVTEAIAYSAGQIAEQHALRGYDAIHLASAVKLQEVTNDVHFLAFDTRLMEAASQLVSIFEI